VRRPPDAPRGARRLPGRLRCRGCPRGRPPRLPRRRRPRTADAHPGRVAPAHRRLAGGAPAPLDRAGRTPRRGPAPPPLLRRRPPRTRPALRPAGPRPAARAGTRLPRGGRPPHGTPAGPLPAPLGGPRPPRTGRRVLRRAVQVPPRPRRRAARADPRRRADGPDGPAHPPAAP